MNGVISMMWKLRGDFNDKGNTSDLLRLVWENRRMSKDYSQRNNVTERSPENHASSWEAHEL